MFQYVQRYRHGFWRKQEEKYTDVFAVVISGDSGAEPFESSGGQSDNVGAFVEMERRENFKRWAAEYFTKEYATNFHKTDSNGNPIVITHDNVKIYYKFEFNRYYIFV